MRLGLIVAIASLLADHAAAQECSVHAPSRASEGYWDYIDSCGCDHVTPVSRASSDYKRFLKACSQWRERHRAAVVVVSQAPTAAASPAPLASAFPDATCANAPSRVSDAFWTFIDACGCNDVSAVSLASPDHARFQRACASWRERNPPPAVVVSPTPGR
jgi:hypothetical protein